MNLKRKTLALTLAGALLFSHVPGWNVLSVEAEGTPAAANELSMFHTMKMIKEEPITKGALLRQYLWTSPEGPVRINEVLVDLQEPTVTLHAIGGKDGKIGVRDNVSDLAQQTGAIAASNADFYVVKGDGSPLGVQVNDGELKSSPVKLQGVYSFGITVDRKPWIEPFTFSGSVTGADGTAFPLSGVNKSLHWQEPEKKQSHIQELHLYTDAWGKAARGTNTGTTPTEALLRDGVVQEISVGQAFPYAPPSGSMILRGHGKAADFIKTLQPGATVQVSYEITPKLDWQMVIGGHGLLVNEGKAVDYTRDTTALGGDRARTAIGFTQDQRYVKWVTIEGNSEASVGVSLNELALLLSYLGAWKAVNMDGGGSTTMVARPLGETENVAIVRPEHETERWVPNGIGLFSTAPSGSLAGLKIQGADYAFLGQPESYAAKGYDEYFNPFDISGQKVQWKFDNSIGTFDNERLVPSFPGKSRVIATLNGIEASKVVQVLGRKDLVRLKAEPETVLYSPGEKVQLTVTAELADGQRLSVPLSSLKWQSYGVSGQVDAQGKLIFSSQQAGRSGFVVGRYDQYSVVVPVKMVEKRGFVDFSTPVEASFESNMDSVTGSFTVEPDAENLNNTVGVLSYRFGDAVGTKAVYASFGASTGGLNVAGEPLGMSVRVRGDRGLHWLRAEFEDAAGKVHRVTLADAVDWTGWRELEAPLTGYGMKYPIQLQRIYLANLAQGQDERVYNGNIAIDNMMFKYATYTEPVGATEVQIGIGKGEMIADGKSSKLQQPPTLLQSTTYVPVRDLSEILGAQVHYDAPTRRVTFYQGARWIDLWQGEHQLILNGETEQLATPVVNQKGVTMVPLRVVSESFGLKVNWQPATKSILLKR